MRLDHANEEVEKFASLFSKELEQPIRTALAALLHIENQLLPATDDPVRRLTRVAIRNLAHVTFVLEQAEAFADLRMLKIHKEPARVRDVLIEAAQDANMRDGAPLAVSCPADLVAMVDLVWIRQILNDLVTAADASRDDIKQQRLVAQRGLDSSQVVIRNVVDLDRAPGNVQSAPISEWTLALCKAIVTAHGGRLWTRLDPEKGLIFAVTLPL